MPIVKDPVAGLLRLPASDQVDPMHAALRRGEAIPDRRANLLRLAWDQTMSYEEAERLLTDDEIDDLCDLLYDMRDDAILARAYAIDEAQRNGWILTDTDRDWFRQECNLPPVGDWSAADERQLSLWRRGVRIEDEARFVAQLLLDTRIPYREIDSRLSTAESTLVHELVDPAEVARAAEIEREMREELKHPEPHR